MEIDWSVGQILDALTECGIDQETLVVFTSDNGPWLSYGNHAGSAAPLREGKGTMFEGGYRVPCIMRWPERIPADTQCDELCSSMDLLPTIADLLDWELPADRPVDGKDIWTLLSGAPDVQSPHDAMYCLYDGQLRAVRDRRWKLHLPHAYRTLSGREGGRDGRPVVYDQAETGLELYDLKQDVGETTNVAELHPEVVSRLLDVAERARDDLGDRLTDRQGKNVRPAGRVN
jgi:arylsulfatase A-like enzyme